MLLPEEQQAWRKFGKCSNLSIGEADKLFFFGPGGSPVRANKFCATCPVKRECLHFAILHKEEGVWAGTTYDERRGLIELGLTADQILNQGLVTREFRLAPEPIEAYVVSAPVAAVPPVLPELLEDELNLDIFLSLPTPRLALLTEQDGPIVREVA